MQDGKAFLLTRLMRGVTVCCPYHKDGQEFLLTRLMRGVTSGGFERVGGVFISTHTPHARRDAVGCHIGDIFLISTHTPHARRDVFLLLWVIAARHFYSHASCEA